MKVYDDYYGYIDKEKLRQIRLEEKKEYFEMKKQRNKTYLKGQRGKRLYYDYEKKYVDQEDNDDYGDYDDEELDDKALERRVKCVYTKELRLEKLYGYLKYLNGRKILIRDLAFHERKMEIEHNKEIFGKSYNYKYIDYVFVDDIGDIIDPNLVTNRFRKILQKNNLKHIRFHDLRHSCASLLVASKIPMKNIQKWLGHSNFNTTADVYSHVDFSAKIESAKIIDKTITRNNDTDNTKKEDISDEEFEEFLEWRRRKKLQQDSEM